MQSRRDQVQAHMFVMGRLTSGVLRLEPDGLDQPVARTSRGALVGFGVSLLIAVGVALYSFIVPGGNSSWKTAGTLVVVKDTGARYLSIDGVLHPVLNTASAKLIAGTSMKVSNVSAKSVRDAPRGAPVGLTGAPDALPDSTALTTGAWMACSTRSRDDAGTTTAGLALAIGLAPSGRSLGSGEAVAVAGPDGNDYLLWNGERLRMDRSDNVVAAVSAAGTVLPPVTASFLDAVPAGPELAVPAVSGAGSAGPQLGGQATRIGQLFSDNSANHYLLSQQGLVALTPMLYALLDADPRTQAAGYAGGSITVRMLGPGDLTGHLAPSSATTALTHDGALPQSLPKIVTISLGQAVCEQLRPGGSAVSTATVIVDSSAVTGQPPDTEQGVAASCLPADTISVKPGSGALVNATLTGGGTGASYYLVTDDGVKYPLPTSDTLSSLGYGSVTPVTVPATWLNLLPTGPVLSSNTVTTGFSMSSPSGGCGLSNGSPGSAGSPGGPRGGVTGGPVAPPPGGAGGNSSGTALRGQGGRTNGQKEAPAVSTAG